MYVGKVLSIPDRDRVYDTRLRLSSHKLAIETGRWSRIRREDRLCRAPVVCVGLLKTEEHVICHCPLSDHIRSQFGTVSFSNIAVFWLCWSWCSLSYMSFDFVDVWLKLSFHFFSCVSLNFAGWLLSCEIVLLYVFAVFLQFDSSVFLFLFSLLAYCISVNKDYYTKLYGRWADAVMWCLYSGRGQQPRRHRRRPPERSKASSYNPHHQSATQVQNVVWGQPEALSQGSVLISPRLSASVIGKWAFGNFTGIENPVLLLEQSYTCNSCLSPDSTETSGF